MDTNELNDQDLRQQLIAEVLVEIYRELSKNSEETDLRTNLLASWRSALEALTYPETP